MKTSTKNTKRTKRKTTQAYEKAIAAIVELRRLPKTNNSVPRLLKAIEAAAAGKRSVYALIGELPMNMVDSTCPPTP